MLRPRADGGVLERAGIVEVMSSLERDGRPVFRDLRWGVYVVFEAPTDYAAACFKQYGLRTDPSGRYAAMYKPFHLIGLELNISVLSAALRGEPTGQPHKFRGDVAAVAKRACARARRWTARAATRSGASCCRRRPASPGARCRSGSRTASGWSATSPRARR